MVDVNAVHPSHRVEDIPVLDSSHGKSLLGIDWRVLHGRPWAHQEHITALEMRALVYSLRHLTRPRQSMGKMYLIPTDSLVGALAITKGRTSAPGLVRGLRQYTSISLRRNVRALPRWIPSELNPADGPSRGGPIESWPDTVIHAKEGWQRLRDKRDLADAASASRELGERRRGRGPPGPRHGPASSREEDASVVPAEDLQGQGGYPERRAAYSAGGEQRERPKPS